MTNAIRELFGEIRRTILIVDASACNGMRLRSGAVKVKHLSTKQPWVQGAIQGNGVDVYKVPPAGNAPDILTHQVGESELKQGFRRMEYYAPDLSLPHA